MFRGGKGGRNCGNGWYQIKGGGDEAVRIDDARLQSRLDDAGAAKVMNAPKA